MNSAEISFSFSTANLFPKPKSLARQNWGVAIGGKADLSVENRAKELARNLGSGLEVVWRRSKDDHLSELFSDKVVKVRTVHAPVFWNKKSLGDHRLQLLGWTTQFAGSELVLGWGEDELRKLVEFAKDHDASIVVHPAFARRLIASPFAAGLNPKMFGYELDWRRMGHEDAPEIVWKRAEGLRDIRDFNMSANPDTSHELITLNPYPESQIEVLKGMTDDYSSYAVAYHFSGVATNPYNPKSVYEGGGALPLNSPRMTEVTRDALKQWAAYVRESAIRPVTLTFEAYGWEGEDREYAVEYALAIMAGDTVRRIYASTSSPNMPTQRSVV